jgi:GNAT superfamily N-acetyltransferase
VLFQQGGETVAYALYWGNPHEIYLRHLYVIRNRRREGIGRQVMHILRDQIWPSDVRLTVEVLLRNTVALAFWRAMGYQDFSMKLEILPKQP